jgi:DNA-3-methyladenine glycosylase I
LGKRTTVGALLLDGLMSGPVIGEDGVARCPWGSNPGVMRDYHDQEWGTRVHGEAAYFERLTLEAFQSGLSWSTILNKRPAFREVFAGFDAGVVASYDETDVLRLMADPRIVRNRRKIDATLTNARATLELREAEGLEAFVLGFRPDTDPVPERTGEMATTSPESIALSKALKKRGFAFVGPTTMFALMEALGVFDPHLVGCHRRGRGTIEG